MVSVDDAIRRLSELNRLDGHSLSDFGWKEFVADGAVGVWVKGRGGPSLIVGGDGVLKFGSRYTPDQAMVRWRNGERTPLAAFPGGPSLLDDLTTDGVEAAVAVAAGLFPARGSQSLLKGSRLKDSDAVFVGESMPGGRAVIVGVEGDLLYCPSSHSIRVHLLAWGSGQRSARSEVPAWNNAGSCALASYLRLTGIDDAVVAESKEAAKREIEKSVGLRFERATEVSLLRGLMSAGPKSAAIIGTRRRSPEPGHWFNATFDGSQLWMVDGQHQHVVPWQEADLGVITEMVAVVGSARL